MFAAAYPGMGAEAQTEMRTMFTTLCNDDTPMVRRAAAKALGVSASLVPRNEVKIYAHPLAIRQIRS
jgi:serine/threonine-protein phosphatase 2A regulatory subunit A